jgi:hypothetical protein
MPVPWLTILDAVLGISSFVRRPAPPDESALLKSTGPALGQLETRMTNVVVAALKEVFDRDSRRLELEREHIEAERQRAERMLRLELARQAGERELSRLRLLAGVAAVSWLGTLFLAVRVADGGVGARVVLGGGWLFLLGALATSFAAQSRVAAALGRAAESSSPSRMFEPGLAGAAAPWLIVAGLALAGVSVLIA